MDPRLISLANKLADYASSDARHRCISNARHAPLARAFPLVATCIESLLTHRLRALLWRIRY